MVWFTSKTGRQTGGGLLSRDTRPLYSMPSFSPYSEAQSSVRLEYKSDVRGKGSDAWSVLRGTTGC